MANSINRLTARGAATLTKPGYHADGGGLYLRVTETGSKGWAFIFQWGGKRKEMGLGALHTVELGEAREKAREARKLVADGVNPIEARKVQKAAEAPTSERTFKAVAERFIQEREGGWKGGAAAKNWRRMLETHAASLGELDVAAITTDDVLAVVRPIWNTKPPTAQRIRSRIEQVLDAARAWKFRTGENPALGKGHLSFILPEQRHEEAHHEAMPFGDLPAFGKRLHGLDTISSRALEFSILCASRPNEPVGATWQEMHLADRLWIIPGERMKEGREHVVTLNDQAVALLEQMGVRGMEPDAYVFPGGHGGSRGRYHPLVPQTLWNCLQRLAPDRGFTVHGFRSSFSDWAAEETDYSHELVEVALSHVVGSQVSRAYRRTTMVEKRRELMQDWGKFVSGETGRPAPNLR